MNEELEPGRHAERAARWARDQLAENPLFLDTETTGLNGCDQVVEISVVDSEGAVVFDSLVRPTIPIPPGATAVHGITDEMVAEAPGFSQVLPALLSAIDGRPVVIYNADYDLRMLCQSALAAGCDELPDIDVYCAMAAYAQFYGEWSDWHGSYKWQQLGRAGRQCGIQVPPNLHRARADAELCRLLVRHMAEGAREEESHATS